MKRERDGTLVRVVVIIALCCGVMISLVALQQGQQPLDVAVFDEGSAVAAVPSAVALGDIPASVAGTAGSVVHFQPLPDSREGLASAIVTAASSTTPVENHPKSCKQS